MAILPQRWVKLLLAIADRPQGAVEIQSMVEKVLHPRPLAEAEKNNIRSLMLPRGGYCAHQL